MINASLLPNRPSKKAAQQVLKAQQALRTIEEKAKAVRVKLETSNAKLYGGRITNPKELQDIQLDVASSKRRLSAFEDEQLTAMIALEEAEAAQAAAEQSLEQNRSTNINRPCFAEWRTDPAYQNARPTAI